MFGIFVYILAILSILFNLQAFFINEEFLIFICCLSFGIFFIIGIKKLLIYYLFFEIKSIYLYFQFLLFNNIIIIDLIVSVFSLFKFKFEFNFISEYLYSILNFYKSYVLCEKYKLKFLKNFICHIFFHVWMLVIILI
jgi:hypothetical protein